MQAVALWIALAAAAPPQGELGPDEGLLTPPVVVTVSRSKQKAFEAPRSVDSVDQARRVELQARSVPEALDETAGVSVQRTNRGAGAPIIRGLIGPQNLILVDGVRFATSTFRTGPNQYLALLDPNIIQRLEVVRGPSSVLYGNGAMGGVVQMLTLDPRLSEEGLEFGGLAQGRFGSADLGGGGTIRAGLRTEELSFFVGGSFDHFGTVRAGGGTDQPHTDYDAGYWQAKLLWSPSPEWQITTAYLGMLMRNAGRTDTLGRGELRFYDNDDHLAYVRAEYSGSGVVQHVRAAASYHRLWERVDRVHCATTDTLVTDLARCTALDEGVIEKKRRNNDTVDVVGGDVSIRLGLLEDRLRIDAGLEVYQDFVSSSREDAKASDGFVYERRPRGNFSDGSRYLDLGTFVNLAGTLLDTGPRHFQIRMNAGGRFSHFEAKAPDVPELGDVEYRFDGFVGSGGLQLLMPGIFHVYGSFVEGFRAPNLQETTVLGNTGSKFEVPNDNLKPERSDTIEVGARGAIGPVTLGVAYFHSWLEDAIDEEPTTYEGKTELDAGTPVIRRVNAAEGKAQGVEGSLGLHVWRFTLRATAAWMQSELTAADGQTHPSRRTPPAFGTASLRYDHPEQRFYVELSTRWAGRQDALHPSDEKDLRICETELHSGMLQAQCEGTPGWATLNLRGGWRPLEYLRADLSITNLLDARYRQHGSGILAAGIDARLTVTATY